MRAYLVRQHPARADSPPTQPLTAGPLLELQVTVRNMTGTLHLYGLRQASQRAGGTLQHLIMSGCSLVPGPSSPPLISPGVSPAASHAARGSALPAGAPWSAPLGDNMRRS